MRSGRPDGRAGVRGRVLTALLGVLTAACLTAACAPAPVGSTRPTAPLAAATPAGPATWDAFAGQRVPALRRLAEPILTCIARRDTARPAFHGCVDWHSAVHATYALLAIGRITGDTGYRDAAVRALGGPQALAAEADAVRAGDLSEEEPYGFAWALVLDVEADRAGIALTHGVGSAARDRLVEYLAGLGDSPRLYRAAAQPDYANVTWPTYALLRWAHRFGDDAAARAADRTAALLLSERGRAAACAGVDETGFLPPCHLLPLLASALDRPSTDLLAALPPLVDTAPLGAHLPAVHSAGLTFSRSWGVYAAYRLSGDPALRDTWARLVADQLAREDQWRHGYDTYAHWVAQFGVFSIAATFDDM